MNKKSFLPLLTLGFSALCAPAFATHPYESCRVTVDLAAVTKALGSEASSVRVRFIYHTNMTDMNPPAAEMVSRPAEGPWVYTKELTDSPYDRTLTGVRIESALYKPEDGQPVWSVQIERPADSEKKDSPFRCEAFAD